MATVFYQNDANPSALKGKTIAVFGYGSQGHAQAQNLRDSGYEVIIGLDPERASAKQARADGMTVVAPAEAAKRADWIQILTPDETQAAFYESAIKPHLRERENAENDETEVGDREGFGDCVAQDAAVFARLLDSFQDHPAAERCGRGHDRSEEPRPSAAAGIYARRRRALTAGHPAGCEWASA